MQRSREERVRVVNQRVYAAKLLECLDGAGDQEAALRLDTVVVEQVAPLPGPQGGLVGAGLENCGVQVADLGGGAVVAVEAGQD